MVTKPSTITGHAPKKKDLFILDMDVHAHESPEALAPYCDKTWRVSLEALAKVPRRYLDIPGFAPALNATPMFPNSGGDRRTTVTSAAQMRQDLNDLGVDMTVRAVPPPPPRSQLPANND